MKAYVLAALFVLGDLFLTAGCCQTYRCGAPPSTIDIRDSAGHILKGALVMGDENQIMACPAMENCSYKIEGGGTFILSAPGYKETPITIGPHFDDCGNAVAQIFQVTLVAESASDMSRSRTILGTGCGG